jgi:hypothetical protein
MLTSQIARVKCESWRILKIVQCAILRLNTGKIRQKVGQVAWLIEVLHVGYGLLLAGAEYV